VRGSVDGHQVAVGNARLLAALGAKADRDLVEAERLRALAQTVMFVVIDGRIAGLLGIGDAIKSTTPEAVRMLHAEGLSLVMLTGDAGRRPKRSRESSASIGSMRRCCPRRRYEGPIRAPRRWRGRDQRRNAVGPGRR
jgi:P-type E1-E2 ATPase